MPSLSWNEIRQRAIVFPAIGPQQPVNKPTSKTFWNEFFLVFGIPRRTVASFEEPGQRIRGTLRAQ